MDRTTPADPVAEAEAAGELVQLRAELELTRAELRAAQHAEAIRAEQVADLRAALEAMARALPAAAAAPAEPVQAERRPAWWRRR